MKKILKRFSAIALCMGLVMSVNSSTAFAAIATAESTKYNMEAQCHEHKASYLVTAKGTFFYPTGQAELRYLKDGRVRGRYIGGKTEYTYWYAYYTNSNQEIKFVAATVTADGVSATAVHN